MNNKKLAFLLAGSLFFGASTSLQNVSSIHLFYPEASIEKELSPLEKVCLEVTGEHQATLGTTFDTLYRVIYSDVNDLYDPLEPSIPKKKTPEELELKSTLKNSLEKKYDALFEELNIAYPPTVWHPLINAYHQIPAASFRKNYHEAIDVFTQEGNEVLSPFTGLVVATGDGWQGTLQNRKVPDWNMQGLTPLAGNALILYNPAEKGYLLLSHFQEGLLVRTGDVVTPGQVLGYVGNTGSASKKGHGEHIHVAYKLPNERNHLQSINPYTRLTTK